MKTLFAVPLFLFCTTAHAQDVVFMGEIHDNPAHHLVQASRVADLAPAAVVFEMLTPEQFDGQPLPEFPDQNGLEKHLDWAHSGWPPFDLYAPVFDAVADARIYGAGVTRSAAMQVMEAGLADSFGDGAGSYGLDQPLSEEQQAEREALQMAAHCDALPEDLLPGMVAVQRLRDAELARAALRAWQDTGGPVAVITGNGHAREDWGAPAALLLVAPDLEVLTLGQTEEEAPLKGTFDEVLSAPRVEREDPCDAFK